MFFRSVYKKAVMIAFTIVITVLVFTVCFISMLYPHRDINTCCRVLVVPNELSCLRLCTVRKSFHFFHYIKIFSSFCRCPISRKTHCDAVTNRDVIFCKFKFWKNFVSMVQSEKSCIEFITFHKVLRVWYFCFFVLL